MVNSVILMLSSSSMEFMVLNFVMEIFNENGVLISILLGLFRICCAMYT